MRKPQSCRHHKAWHLHFDGYAKELQPAWCPECGALRIGKYAGNGKLKAIWIKPKPPLGKTP
jgi:hypothetical protein